MTESAIQMHHGNLKGLMSESNNCVDCGVNTAPGLLTRIEMEIAIIAMGDRWHNGEGVKQALQPDECELYMVRDAVWKAAGMEPYGGCLCIGCLERRIGRKLKRKDFPRDHSFNDPELWGKYGTARLKNRRR